MTLRNRTPLRLAGCLIAAGWISGCTMGPDYRRPEVQLPPAYAPAAARDAAPAVVAPAPAASAAALPRLAATEAALADRSEPARGGAELLDSAWWKAFGDPQLDALVQEALQGNRDLRIATLRIEQFDAYLQVSRSAGLPQVRGNASRTRDTLSENRQVPLVVGARPVDNAYSASLSASWELDLWGQLSRADEAAMANLQASEESRRAVAQSVVSEVVLAYVRLLSLDRSLALMREAVDSERENVRLSESRFANGGSSELPVLQAVSTLQARLPELPAKEAQIATLENAIGALLGRDPGPLPRGKSIDALALPQVPGGLPASLLAQRPDLRQAEQELVAANAAIGVAKAQYLPSISLTASSGFASNELSEMTLLSSNFGSFGVNILGPIFSAGRIAGQVREAEARQKQAAENYLKALQTALHEVQDALVTHAKRGQQIRLHDLHVQTLREQRALAVRRYEGGASNYFQVVEAERALVDGLLARNDAQREQATSLIAIYKAMGGGWSLPDVTANLAIPSKTDHD